MCPAVVPCEARCYPGLVWRCQLPSSQVPYQGHPHVFKERVGGLAQVGGRVAHVGVMARLAQGAWAVTQSTNPYRSCLLPGGSGLCCAVHGGAPKAGGRDWVIQSVPCPNSNLTAQQGGTVLCSIAGQCQPPAGPGSTGTAGTCLCCCVSTKEATPSKTVQTGLWEGWGWLGGPLGGDRHGALLLWCSPCMARRPTRVRCSSWCGLLGLLQGFQPLWWSCAAVSGGMACGPATLLRRGEAPSQPCVHMQTTCGPCVYVAAVACRSPHVCGCAARKRHPLQQKSEGLLCRSDSWPLRAQPAVLAMV